jgi:putative membrane protein
MNAPLLPPAFVRVLPPQHGDPWLLRPPLWTNWQIDPTVLLGVFALAAGYVLLVGPLNERRADAASRPVSRGQRASFFAACAALLIALGPPLEDWAGLLVSGHMAQHLILMFVVPPLLLYGTPPWLLEPVLRWPLVARVGCLLTRPLVAFVLSSAVVILWHFPTLYEASLNNDLVHVVQHQMFLATAVLVWWPLLGPLPAWPRAVPLVQILLLVAMTFPGGIVGSFLTLGKPGFYPSYTTVPRMWGIDLATDQQVAGLAMWVGGSVVYLLLVTVVFFRWAAREEERESDPAPATPKGAGSPTP